MPQTAPEHRCWPGQPPSMAVVRPHWFSQSACETAAPALPACLPQGWKQLLQSAVVRVASHCLGPKQRSCCMQLTLHPSLAKPDDAGCAAGAAARARPWQASPSAAAPIAAHQPRKPTASPSSPRMPIRAATPSKHTNALRHPGVPAANWMAAHMVPQSAWMRHALQAWRAESGSQPHPITSRCLQMRSIEAQLTHPLCSASGTVWEATGTPRSTPRLPPQASCMQMCAAIN